MISIQKHLQGILSRAAVRAMPELKEVVDVQPEKKEEWDYVSPSAMKFFNMHKKKGSFGFASCKDMAEAIVGNIVEEDNDAIQKIELSQIGKGDPAKSGFFMNITLKDSFIQNQVKNVYSMPHVTLHESAKQNQRVLVDFSSPNIAKNMHVGHLRSTIQGDSICRVFEFLGNHVMRINHLGDWGTQFGMLIAELDKNFPDFLDKEPEVTDLQTFYQNAKKRFDEDEDFKKTAHENVVKLQGGDEHCLAAWKMLCALSEKEFTKIYNRLDVKLEPMGESFYNPMLKPLVEEFKERGLCQESNGAQCIFVPKQKVPVMLLKSDGGFNYDTTDMAALRYRVNEQKADRILYVTDVGQELHFKLIFAAGQQCEIYNPKITTLNHMMFGMVLRESEEEVKEGEKKKVERIKTREGKTIKLEDLLNEAKARALAQFKERLEGDENNKVQVDMDKLEETAEILGISAIKYYDLKQNRIQNYVFSFDKMLDPRGNTGIYLLYAYVRVLSIMRKAKYEEEVLAKIKAAEDFVITNKSERELALAILRLPDQLELTVKDLQLNRICDLVYEISERIGDFWTNSKVIGTEEEVSRILLLESTRMVMEVSFHLLGMKTIDKI